MGLHETSRDFVRLHIQGKTSGIQNFKTSKDFMRLQGTSWDFKRLYETSQTSPDFTAEVSPFPPWNSLSVWFLSRSALAVLMAICYCWGVGCPNLFWRIRLNCCSSLMIGKNDDECDIYSREKFRNCLSINDDE